MNEFCNFILVLSVEYNDDNFLTRVLTALTGWPHTRHPTYTDVWKYGSSNQVHTSGILIYHIYRWVNNPQCAHNKEQSDRY